MRIVLLANRDIASLVAINQLICEQPTHNYQIFLSASVGGKPKTQSLAELAFFEQRLFNEMLFPAIAGESNQSNHSTTASLLTFEQLQRHGIAVNQIDDINSPLGHSQIASFKPHLLLSIRFGQILRPEAIALPEFGVINLHSGQLPQYRGVMATFWAMLNNESHIGSTLHYIDDAQIDAGRVISMQSQPLNLQKSYLENVINLYPPGIRAMAQAIELIAQGELPEAQTMDLSQGHYYSFPLELDFEQFRQQGLTLIDYDYIGQLTRRFISSGDPL